MVARFEPLWVSYWQGGGMYLGGGSTATVSGTSYTSCSADEVSRCTWGRALGFHCSQNVDHVTVWAMAHLTLPCLTLPDLAWPCLTCLPARFVLLTAQRPQVIKEGHCRFKRPSLGFCSTHNGQYSLSSAAPRRPLRCTVRTPVVLFYERVY